MEECEEDNKIVKLYGPVAPFMHTNSSYPDTQGQLGKITDFKVEFTHSEILGFHICLSSESLGLLCSFSYWDHAEKNMPQHPVLDFDDVDQGFSLLITHNSSCVSVSYGNEVCTYDTFFSVPMKIYEKQWKAAYDALQAYKKWKQQ